MRFLNWVFVAGCFLLLPQFVCAFQSVKGDVPVTSNSDEAIKCFLDGREAYEMGRAFDAAALFEKAVTKDPGFAMAWLCRAYAASFLLNTPLDFDLALKNRQKFVEMRPNESAAWLALGDVNS